jgi:hypothetical protein
VVVAHIDKRARTVRSARNDVRGKPERGLSVLKAVGSTHAHALWFDDRDTAPELLEVMGIE